MDTVLGIIGGVLALALFMVRQYEANKKQRDIKQAQADADRIDADPAGEFVRIFNPGAGSKDGSGDANKTET